MIVITRDRVYGWNVKLPMLPHVWFGDRSAAVRFVASADCQRYLLTV